MLSPRRVLRCRHRRRRPIREGRRKESTGHRREGDGEDHSSGRYISCDAVEKSGPGWRKRERRKRESSALRTQKPRAFNVLCERVYKSRKHPRWRRVYPIMRGYWWPTPGPSSSRPSLGGAFPEDGPKVWLLIRGFSVIDDPRCRRLSVVDDLASRWLSVIDRWFGDWRSGGTIANLGLLRIDY